ncbi:hypothetical protein EJB05_26545, partial [Eragrostis curvula]
MTHERDVLVHNPNSKEQAALVGLGAVSISNQAIMSSTRNRKYDSGFEKRKKKQRLEAAAQCHKGDMDRFVVKAPQFDSENQTTELEAQVEENQGQEDGNIGVQLEARVEEIGQGDDANIADEVNGSTDDVDTSFQTDIFDPRMWDALDSKMIDISLQKGPKRDLSITKGPKDKTSRRFSATAYTRVHPNGEMSDRKWLVYRKELDKVFCFGCKLLRKGLGKGQLVNEGLNDWHHLTHRLKEHEVTQRELEKERDHWRKVLYRLILIVKFLAEHNLAFRGTNCKLNQDNNGNFLGLIEMIAEFDPIMQQHVQRITNDEMRVHFLGPSIQNELISLLATAIRSEILRKIKEAKYFSVLIDCTPDASHQEQMSLIIRYVDASSGPISVEESFLGFLDVNDTSGQGLFDVLKDELKNLDLDLDNVRGQGYDNGSNMKGKHKGVQKKFLDTNPRAFYSACSRHSLNLTLCDMAKSCEKAKNFFGVIQRIYQTFAKSTKKWQILKDNITGYTLKSLSCTRWESRVDREALLQVAESDNDPLTSSEAKSLADNELGDFEFLLAVIIWYEILSAVNLVSKQLQAKDMIIDIATERVQGLISFFNKYRENGFPQALEAATEVALDMGIDPVFRTKRKIKRKRQFDETTNDESTVTQSAQESFRVNYFIAVVDQAIASLTTRFEQYQGFEKIFGFLFTSNKLCSLDDKSLFSSCINLEAALKSGEKSDIDGKELFVELKLVRDLIKESMGPLDILKYLKQLGCFPNAVIAYRILLTVPVTVASAERSFSKLKLLKSYLRSTMTQERVNALATIALESVLLEQIKAPFPVSPLGLKNSEMALLRDDLDGKVEGDVKFKVGRKTFTAHRSILAFRSSVFMAELFGTMKKKKAAATVHINDMEPRVFKAFLHFIYTCVSHYPYYY